MRPKPDSRRARERLDAIDVAQQPRVVDKYLGRRQASNKHQILRYASRPGNREDRTS